VLATDPRHTDHRRLLDSLVAKLSAAYRTNASEQWRWFESTLTVVHVIPTPLWVGSADPGVHRSRSGQPHQRGGPSRH